MLDSPPPYPMRRGDRALSDPKEILHLIEAADSCRLGLVDVSGEVPRPYVVALNYGYLPGGQDGLGGTFYFHGAVSGRKLELIRNHSEACLELDLDHEPVKHPLGCGWGMRYASVFATGRASIVHDEPERLFGLRCLLDHYLRLWGPLESGNSPAFGPDAAGLARTVVFRFDVLTLSAKRKG